MNELQLQWNACLDFIKDNISSEQYKTWFEPIVPLSYSREMQVLKLGIPSEFFFEYLESHFISILSKSIYRTFGKDTQLKYQVLIDKENHGTVDVPSSGVTKPVVENGQKTYIGENQAPLHGAAMADFDSHLIQAYRFENFVEGTSNKLPRSIGESIAEQPGRNAFNPLFIYGPSGVGKTHLINAIGLRIKELYPEKRVLYISAHLFLVQYTDSVRKNLVNDFLHFYQSIDVLIIDDVQEFASLKGTQVTFFHIFNHLHQNNRQIIMTSDRPPVALEGMEERLLTRFKWGLQVEMDRPNETLRKDILRKKIDQDGLKFPESVVDYIAQNVDGSVRELEGVVNSFLAFSIVYKCDIDLNLAERIVHRAAKEEKKKAITIDTIIDKVCEHYTVKRADIFTKSRKRAIVQVRQIAMYLAQQHTPLSISRIGTLVGNRDHATVLHSCKIVSGRMDVDSSFRNEVHEIDASLTV